MESGESPGAAPDPDLVDALVEQLQALAPAPAPPAPAEEEERRRDWAGGLPAEVLAKIAAAVPRRRRRPIHRASDAWDRGSALLAITCKGWKEALKQNAVARAGGAEVWRDWGNRFGEGLPAEVLAKIAETHAAQAEADWAAGLKRRDPDWWTEERIQEETAKGNCLFAFAMVGKAWRKAQLAVGGRLCTRVESDVIGPGRVALAKWALAEGCPRENETGFTAAASAAEHGHRVLVQWLIQEQGFAMDTIVMAGAARSGNLELVRWLRGEGCDWDAWTCYWAVDKGHVEVLRWARENGCPWHAETRDRAAAELGYADDLGNLVDYHGDPVQQ